MALLKQQSLGMTTGFTEESECCITERQDVLTGNTPNYSFFFYWKFPFKTVTVVALCSTMVVASYSSVYSKGTVNVDYMTISFQIRLNQQ